MIREYVCVYVRHIHPHTHIHTYVHIITINQNTYKNRMDIEPKKKKEETTQKKNTEFYIPHNSHSIGFFVLHSSAPFSASLFYHHSILYYMCLCPPTHNHTQT